jgi:alpha-L-fucosidase
LYTGAFLPTTNGIKAVAIDSDGQRGAVVEETLGIAKRDWKVRSSSGAREKFAADKAIDGDENSFWHSQSTGADQFIEIDLGRAYDVSGFAYTPQRKDGEGMMAKGVLKISVDGENWQDAEGFEFGNLINDPSKRKHLFRNKINTRYIRVISTEITGGGNSLSVAELDFYN